MAWGFSQRPPQARMPEGGPGTSRASCRCLPGLRFMRGKASRGPAACFHRIHRRGGTGHRQEPDGGPGRHRSMIGHVNTVARMLICEHPELDGKCLECTQDNSLWLIQVRRCHPGLPYQAREIPDGFQGAQSPRAASHVRCPEEPALTAADAAGQWCRAGHQKWCRESLSQILQTIP